MLKKILFILDIEQKKQLIFFYFLSLLIIVLELLSLTMVIPVVETILNPETVSQYLEYLPAGLFNMMSANLIFSILVVFNILIILKNIFLFFAQKYQVRFISEYNQKLQVKLFKSYIYQPISNLVKNNIAIINRNVIDLSIEYTNSLLNPFITILADLVLFLFVLGLLIFAEPTITIFGLAIITIIGASIFSINKKILLINGEKYKLNKSERIKSLNETFGAILEVKSFKKENQFIEKFERFTKILKDVQIKISILGFVPKLMFEVLGIFLISIFFLILSQRTEDMGEMLAIVVLFAFAITKMIPLINKILINSQRIKFSQPLLNEIYSTLFLLLKRDDDNLKSLKFDNAVNLVSVNYQYEKSNYILKDLNLLIKKNKFIAITGASGSGKSTLLKLILGLMKPTEGKILVDDQSIFSNIGNWQEKVNFVPQDVFILDDNLKNNITLETSDEKIDFDKLELAIDVSNLKNFVSKLNNGYNTILGDKGSRISGGQKQRIGIARAIYVNSEIIIFDESTSSIDEESEIVIFNKLKQLKNKTVIFVTHKNTVKKYCDELYLLENNILKKEVYKRTN